MALRSITTVLTAALSLVMVGCSWADETSSGKFPAKPASAQTEEPVEAPANTATEDGGGTYFYTTTGTVFNTIIAGNRAYGISTDPTADCYENGLKSLGFNLSGSGTGCDMVTTTDFIIAPSQVFSAVLEPVLAANGSPRQTHALIERGYAVDAGYCPGTNGDQRGFPRPYDDLRMPNALDGCDIGAFEWQPADTKIKGPKP